MADLRARPGHADALPHAVDVNEDAPRRKDPRARRVVASFTVVTIIFLIVLAAVLTWIDAGSSAASYSVADHWLSYDNAIQVSTSNKKALPAAASSHFRGHHIHVSPAAFVAGMSTNLTLHGVYAGARLRLEMQPPCSNSGCHKQEWIAAAPSSNVSVQLQAGMYALLLGEQRLDGDVSGADGGDESGGDHKGGAVPPDQMMETGVRLTAAQPMPLAPKQVGRRQP